MQTNPTRADAQRELLAFLQKYNDYLCQVLEAQNEKLEALLSHEVEHIERCAVQQQALTLQMQQYEETRAKLQQAAGWEGLTFRQLAEQAEEPLRADFQRCRTEMDRLLDQIKFLNGKAMHLVETDLRLIDLAQPLESRAETQGYTEDGRQREAAERTALLDSKI